MVFLLKKEFALCFGGWVLGLIKFLSPVCLITFPYDRYSLFKMYCHRLILFRNSAYDSDELRFFTSCGCDKQHLTELPRQISRVDVDGQF